MTLTLMVYDGIGRTSEALQLLLETAPMCPRVSKLRLLTADPEACHGEIECINVPATDYLGYQRFCVQDLTRFVDTDFVMLIQFDGLVLNPDRWDDEFLAYDYIGAPWQHRRTRPVPDGCSVGNGGFSIRSKAFLDACSRLSWHTDWHDSGLAKRYWGNEDYFLSVMCRKELAASGIRFAPPELAAKFSIQSGDRLGRIGVLHRVYGFHGPRLLGKARRHLERRGIHYSHLTNVRKSFRPLLY